MNDRDVIARVCALLDSKVNGPYGKGRSNNPNTQAYYAVDVYSDKARDLMTLVRPLMGERRRLAIDAAFRACSEPYRDRVQENDEEESQEEAA